jgi:hypothetical protein
MRRGFGRGRGFSRGGYNNYSDRSQNDGNDMEMMSEGVMIQV